MICLHGDVLVNLGSVSVKAAFVAEEHLSLSGLGRFFLVLLCGVLFKGAKLTEVVTPQSDHCWFVYKHLTEKKMCNLFKIGSNF